MAHWATPCFLICGAVSDNADNIAKQGEIFFKQVTRLAKSSGFSGMQ